MSESRTFAERLATLDPKLVYGILMLAVVVPILYPLNLPITVSATTKSLYDVIEALPAGSLVWYDVEPVASYMPELLPAIIATMRHLFSKPVKTMYVSFYPDGPMSYQRALSSISVPPEKKYGVDYVFMGFIAGDETGITALAANVKGVASKDAYGTPVESIPMLKDVTTVRDFALVIMIGSASPVIDQYIRQVNARYGVKVAGGTIGSVYPEKLVYFPHQLVGWLNGLKGAAEYEKLMNTPGKAMAAMDAFSVAQCLLLAFIVIVNVGYFTSRKKVGGT